MSNRLSFRAHPAFGLKPARAEDSQAVPEHDLPPWWTGLSDDVQDEQLDRFFATVLSFLGQLCPTIAVAEVPLPHDRERIEVLSVDRRSGRRYVFTLSPPLAAVLPSLSVVSMRVTCVEEEVIMELRDGWEGVFLFLNEEDAAQLDEQLRSAGAMGAP